MLFYPAAEPVGQEQIGVQIGIKDGVIINAQALDDPKTAAQL